MLKTECDKNGTFSSSSIKKARVAAKEAWPAAELQVQAPTNEAPTNEAPTNEAPTNEAPTNEAFTNKAPTNVAPSDVAEAFDLDDPGDPRELLWKVRQAQDDCASFAMALLKSRDLDGEDDHTILARLPSKSLSVLAVERLLNSESFKQRTQRLLKRKEINRDHDEDQKKAIKLEEADYDTGKIFQPIRLTRNGKKNSGGRGPTLGSF